VLVAADTAIVSARADATVMVVRAGKTAAEAIEHARQTLNRSGARITGFVVNGLKHSGRYGRDYYYYKYGYTREPGPSPRPLAADPPSQSPTAPEPLTTA
jgi:Mrp family chromosome partitioning ATPase